jgi:hypothetical protein
VFDIRQARDAEQTQTKRVAAARYGAGARTQQPLEDGGLDHVHDTTPTNGLPASCSLHEGASLLNPAFPYLPRGITLVAAEAKKGGTAFNCHFHACLADKNVRYQPNAGMAARVTLDARQEAALVAYIALFDTCKAACRRAVREAVLAHGTSSTAVVYRGQARRSATVTHATPFFSTTPKRKMAELFVERDWEQGGRPVGHLFKIHLVKVPTLSTRDVRYTLSPAVLARLMVCGNKESY